MIVVVSSHSALHLFDDHNDSKISKRSSQTEVKEPLGGALVFEQNYWSGMRSL